MLKDASPSERIESFLVMLKTLSRVAAFMVDARFLCTCPFMVLFRIFYQVQI